MLRRRLMKKGIPEGAINGKFSVGATKKVYFSKGNLQLIGENAWQFADNQWRRFGTSQSNNHRDLFGWGTGNNPNQISENNGDYSTFIDWGSNAISNGGNKAGLWRTLTIDEWEYLFNTRTVNGGTGEGKSYTLGQKVNNVLGVVLYPDGYTGELYTTAQSDNWSTFEAAGCVFLPTTGSRVGTTTSSHSAQGMYHSSTRIAVGYVECMGLNMNGIDFYQNGERIGKAVRLVYDIK